MVAEIPSLFVEHVFDREADVTALLTIGHRHIELVELNPFPVAAVSNHWLGSQLVLILSANRALSQAVMPYLKVAISALF